MPRSAEGIPKMETDSQSDLTLEEQFDESKGAFQLMIVDDEPVATKFLRFLLERKGYSRIKEATCGAEAIANLHEKTFHLVLLDKMLPDMDGLEVLSQGKEIQPDCEFILMTAYSSVQSAVASLDSGASGYITKPFNDLEGVVQQVEKALEIVSLRIENDLLIDRLQKLVTELRIAEAALQVQRANPKTQGTDPMKQQEVRNASARLRKLATNLDRLSTRLTGRAANLFGGFEQTITSVAELLEKTKPNERK